MTTYGIEIECASPVSDHAVMTALTNAGLRAVTANYSGRNYRVWQVKYDATIPTNRTARHRIEVVSPVLSWGDPDSLEQVRTVSEVLTALGCKVLRPRGGSSAGLHVHVSMHELSPTGLASWFRNWGANQATTDSLVRSGRETGGAHNNWCAVLSPSTLDRCVNAAQSGDARSLARAASGHHLAVNTQWFHERGTIEVRQRDGAINWRKQIGWVAYILATKAHADGGQVFTGGPTQGDYLTWLVDMGYLTDEHRAWAERNVSVVAQADTVTTEARSRFGGLRQAQGI